MMTFISASSMSGWFMIRAWLCDAYAKSLRRGGKGRVVGVCAVAAVAAEIATRSVHKYLLSTVGFIT